MQTYLVGGAVRDALLGLPVKDRDWVVVGASVQQMLDQGFVPVGKDFPVFLHPRSKEQYALARTERKTAPGYRGFVIHAAPDVTLEQDLARRDLSINAIAVAQRYVANDAGFDPANAVLIDPHHGQRDLRQRVLRHVGDAFREDPVRILRVARLAARFADFNVADETMALMRAMVAHGEARSLVAERVWQELSRGLMEQRPSRMLQVLQDCHALEQLLPELQPGPAAGPPNQSVAQMLDRAAAMQETLPVRFAILCLRLADASARERLCARLRVPNDCRDLALLAARERDAVAQSRALDAPALVQLLERCDAFRKPARFDDLLRVCAIRQPAAALSTDPNYPPRERERALAALAAAQSVHTEAVARSAQDAGLAGTQVGAAINTARVQAVAALLDADRAATDGARPS